MPIDNFLRLRVLNNLRVFDADFPEIATMLTEAQKKRSNDVAANRRATEERRAKLAAEYRARLQAQIGNATASEDALIETAVSAYVTVRELSDRFVRGRANPYNIRSLELARGQLQRTLLCLGLASYDNAPHEEPRDPSAPRSLAEFTERWAARKAAEEAEAKP